METEKDIQKAIIETISYFSLFEFPLQLSELSRFLLRYSLSASEMLKIVKETPGIVLENDYVIFSDQHSLIQKREIFQQQNEKLWKKIRFFVPFLRFFPFVRSVCICNHIPYGIVKEKSDIDLFIITESKHMFVARFFTTLFLHILKVRRHGTYIKERFCLSFYATSQGLNLSQIEHPKQDIYLAYWLFGLYPVFGFSHYEKCMHENKDWISFYFHDQTIQNMIASRKKTSRYEESSWIQKFQEFLWKTSLFQIVEKYIRKYQLRHIQENYNALEHKEGTVISDDMLKFHDRDFREKYYEMWQKKVSEKVDI